MARTWIIAMNTVRETLHRRAVYAVLGVGVLLLLLSLTPLAVLGMAREAGESAIAERIATQLVESFSSGFAFTAIVLAIFLGATAVSHEVRTRTIVTLLARPVERWELLMGRWLGVQLFALGVLAVGTGLALSLATYYGLETPARFWAKGAENVVDVSFAGAVSVGLGAFLPAIVAGLVAYALPFVASMVAPFMRSPRLSIRGPATLTYHLVPAEMPASLMGETFTREVLEPRYGLFAAVVLEHALYAAAVFVIGCFVFTRREIRLGS